MSLAYRRIGLDPARCDDRQHIADAALELWRSASSDTAPDRLEVAKGGAGSYVTSATLYLIWDEGGPSRATERN